jgi:glucose-1-phosphate cytidylyltransferase
MLTYGDGLCDINLQELLKFHYEHKKLVTVTGIQPEAKFGSIDIDKNGNVNSFKEKPKGDGKWINGGFFICNKKIFNYLSEDSNNIMWEDEPLEKIVESNQLVAYKHNGFWKCMDALRDKIELDIMWNNNNAKWKTWK